ncbi:hypothetical protein [Lysinibacillus piscis]|uniref:Uncharacterized protein n=1 Tax=Lysinibacillus piscis TaxID=2518931 RepID=A0ABQ5NQS8_9BACI|nr:hypothetical protein [Lysinibacillus sp. KH24]GLC90483.1 hypothetical protein LYSBPC_36100 [Lysinibacillus sp. KH24]
MNANFFLIVLGIIYLLLAAAVETAILSTLYGWIGFVLILFGSIRYIKKYYRATQVRRAQQSVSEDEFKAIPHTQCLLAEDALSALLLNEPSSTMIFATRESLTEDIAMKNISFHKIYEVAIVEDDMVIAHTCHQLISDSLLAIVEDEEESEAVNKLALQIVVDNLTTPILEYVFIDNDKAIARADDAYQEQEALCEEWFQKISIIIKRHELERVPIRS